MSDSGQKIKIRMLIEIWTEKAWLRMFQNEIKIPLTVAGEASCITLRQKICLQFLNVLRLKETEIKSSKIINLTRRFPKWTSSQAVACILLTATIF